VDEKKLKKGFFSSRYFSFFCLQPPLPKTKPNRNRKNQLHSDKYKILVADKDKFFASKVKSILINEFPSVTIAEDGYHVLSLCQKIPFSLAIIGNPLFGILGIEIVRRLEQKYPKMKRILTSEYETDPIIESSLDYGIIDRFIQKPMDLQDLLWEVEFLLGLNPDPPHHQDDEEEESGDYFDSHAIEPGSPQDAIFYQNTFNFSLKR
jgi:DNA-binding NtrC family response regulator